MTDTKSILEAGQMLASPREIDGTPFVVVPQNSEVHILDDLLKNPTRVNRSVHVHDVDSFVAYVKSFQEPGARVFYNQFEAGGPSFKAVLDYHESTVIHCVTAKLTEGLELEKEPGIINHIVPRSCSHEVHLKPRMTPEWQRWTAANGRKMTQEQFAQFIEMNADDISNNDGPTLAAIAANLAIHKDVSYSSAVRLESGAIRLKYEEDVNGSTASGALTFPASFNIILRPFIGGAMYEVECKFRYRLPNKQAELWFEIARPERVIDAAMASMRLTITEKTGLITLAGE